MKDINRKMVDNIVPPMQVIGHKSNNSLFWKITAVTLLFSVLLANGYQIYTNHLQIKKLKEKEKI